MKHKEIFKDYNGVIVKGTETLNKQVIIPQWKQQREKFLYDGTITNQNLREIQENEIIIEFDFIKESNIGSEEFNKKRNEAEKWIEKVKEILSKWDIKFYITDHKGKSPHIRFRINGLEEYELKYIGQYKLILAKDILSEIKFNSELVQLDEGLLTSTSKLIPIEEVPHWKQKWKGAIEEIVYENKEGKVPEVRKELMDSIIKKMNSIVSSNIEGDAIGLKITDVLDLRNFNKRNAEEYIGENPWHGSSTGKNFTINPSKNVAHCFRCNAGLSPIKCLALNEGIINNCSEELKGEKFKETINIGKEKKKINEEKQELKIIPKFATYHMFYFNEFNRITQLIGDEYIPIKKACYRQLISMAISKDVIEVGDVYTDKRIHILYPMGSGDGKRNIKYATKEIAKVLGKEVAEPSSIHSEQLIGKVLERKIKKGSNPESDYGELLISTKGNSAYVMNKGYLSDDMLQLEESKEFFTSKDKDYVECREKLCIGLDPIGRNEITKRSVENLRGEEVRYNPKCITQAFLQKYSLPEEVVLKGIIRRFLIPYVSLNLENRDYEQKWNAPKDFMNSIEKVVNYLRKIKAVTEKDFEFNDESIEALKKYHKVIVEYGKSFSQKCYNFTKIVDWTLQEFLVKFVVNTAAGFLTNKVTKEIVEIAFMDLIELWHLNLTFIDEKVYGNLDYGEGYKGSNIKERLLLDWLSVNGASSEKNSKVSIAAFIEEVKKVFKTDSESTARSKYLKMKEKKLIDSKQEGKHDSKVWITFDIKKGVKGFKGFKGYIEYNLIFNKLKNNLSSIKPLQPLEPLLKFKAEAQTEILKDVEESEFSNKIYHKCSNCNSKVSCEFIDGKPYCFSCKQEMENTK